MPFEPISSQRKSVAIVRQITDLIGEGVLPQGERLPSEPELAKRFEVSRSVVREAIRTLEAMGFVSVQRGYGGGTFVQGATDDYHRVASTGYQIENLQPSDLFDVRARLEPLGCRLAVFQVGGNASLELRRLLLDVHELDATPALALGAIADFHVKVAELSANPLIQRIVEDLRPSILTMLSDRVWSPEWRKGSHQDTRFLLELIESGDAEGAEGAMSRHLLTWQAP